MHRLCVCRAGDRIFPLTSLSILSSSLTPSLSRLIHKLIVCPKDLWTREFSRWMSHVCASVSDAPAVESHSHQCLAFGDWTPESRFPSKLFSVSRGNRRVNGVRGQTHTKSGRRESRSRLTLHPPVERPLLSLGSKKRERIRGISSSRPQETRDQRILVSG